VEAARRAHEEVARSTRASAHEVAFVHRFGRALCGLACVTYRSGGGFSPRGDRRLVYEIDT
jgi:hypothetical protein